MDSISRWYARDADGTLNEFRSEPSYDTRRGKWAVNDRYRESTSYVKRTDFPAIQPGDLYRFDLTLVERPYSGASEPKKSRTVFEPSRGAI